MLLLRFYLGLNIFADRTFFVGGDHEEECRWEEYGFRMYLPKGVLKEKEHDLITARAVFGGRFVIPPGWQLVSGIYALSIPTKIQKKLQVEIEHCVDLDNLPNHERLQFISCIVKCTYPEECQFTFIEEGNFTAKRHFGVLQFSSLKEGQDHLLGIVLQDKDSSNDSLMLGGKGETKGKSTNQSHQHDNGKNGSNEQDQNEDEKFKPSQSTEPTDKKGLHFLWVNIRFEVTFCCIWYIDPVQYYAYINYQCKSRKECHLELIAIMNLSTNKQVIH